MSTGARTVLVAACVLIDADGRVLIARRPEGRSLAGFWEFPGGKIETGEELVAALEREVREETGLKVSVGRPFATWHFVKEPFWVTGVTFVCDRLSGEVVLSREHSEHAWIEPGAYGGYPLATSMEGQLGAYLALLAETGEV